VPTSHDRIPVTKDPTLADALVRAREVVGEEVPTATLVHDLAIRGAEALIAEQRQNDEAIERLIRRSTAADPGYDREVLADIARRGWDRD
jgi:hypothetical protein